MSLIPESFTPMDYTKENVARFLTMIFSVVGFFTIIAYQDFDTLGFIILSAIFLAVVASILYRMTKIQKDFIILGSIAAGTYLIMIIFILINQFLLLEVLIIVSSLIWVYLQIEYYNKIRSFYYDS
jgi:hypothetical protein